MIAFYLEKHSGVPAYQQLIQQVHRALLLGQLKPGDQLPSVRAVVAQLSINSNTVMKAYREMELTGLVESRPGAGTFILSTPPPIAPSTFAILQQSFSAWLCEARSAGLDDATIHALITHTLQSPYEEKSL